MKVNVVPYKYRKRGRQVSTLSKHNETSAGRLSAGIPSRGAPFFDPYVGISSQCREQARDRSYENTRLKIAEDIIALMVESGMTHKDLARALGMKPSKFKVLLWDSDMRLSTLNRILDVFSHEMVTIFRKRWPVTHN